MINLISHSSEKKDLSDTTAPVKVNVNTRFMVSSALALGKTEFITVVVVTLS